MNNKLLVGKRIKELRKKHNLSQEKLAELTNLEPTSLSNIENGRNYPLFTTLEKILCVFNSSFYDFFNFNHNKEAKDLIQEINTIIKENPDKIKDIYKVVKALTE